MNVSQTSRQTRMDYQTHTELKSDLDETQAKVENKADNQERYSMYI